MKLLISGCVTCFDLEDSDILGVYDHFTALPQCSGQTLVCSTIASTFSLDFDPGDIHLLLRTVHVNIRDTGETVTQQCFCV